MLFAYTYVPHDMEKMQGFIDFIFFEVWCNAPTSGRFQIGLFDKNVDLKEMMIGLHHSNTFGGNFFYGYVKKIFERFASLSHPQITQLKQWYNSNNDIEKACANDPAIHVATYKDIKSINPELSKLLKSFFTGLWNQRLLKLAELQNKISCIDDHYDKFVKVNDTGKCPFCGLIDIKGENHTKREAYDHYLSKALYPFNSINFHNLVPICNTCNSAYKLQKDPLHRRTGQRRKAFYPYATSGSGIDISINLNTSNIVRITPDNIQVTFGPADVQEEIETWKELYNIEERYKAKCCSESDGKYWLTQVIDEWMEDGRPPESYLNTLDRLTNRNPFVDNNFLKRAFLKGCQQIGLFDNSKT